MFFSFVIEIYEHYEAPCAISLFQMKDFFSTIFGVSNSIFFSCNPIRFPALSNNPIRF